MGRLSGCLLMLLLLGVSGWLGVQLVVGALPSVDDLPALVHGRLERRSAPYTDLDQIPLMVRQATVVTEDERFYQHHGIDVTGLLRSMLDDARARCLCEGGSTITEQLAKQVYLGGNDATFSGKLASMVLAVEIERRYDKAEILELYLNTAYYGHGAYGVGAAARTYWRRPVAALDLAQAAMLAGLPQAPSDYDPLAHPDAARRRRDEVLQRLVDSGLISRSAAIAAGAQSLT
jgi:membrane peptidoglycan carboxypeptidase